MIAIEGRSAGWELSDGTADQAGGTLGAKVSLGDLFDEAMEVGDVAQSTAGC